MGRHPGLSLVTRRSLGPSSNKCFPGEGCRLGPVPGEVRGLGGRRDATVSRTYPFPHLRLHSCPVVIRVCPRFLTEPEGCQVSFLSRCVMLRGTTLPSTLLLFFSLSLSSSPSPLLMYTWFPCPLLDFPFLCHSCVHLFSTVLKRFVLVLPCVRFHVVPLS